MGLQVSGVAEWGSEDSVTLSPNTQIINASKALTCPIGVYISRTRLFIYKINEQKEFPKEKW